MHAFCPAGGRNIRQRGVSQALLGFIAWYGANTAAAATSRAAAAQLLEQVRLGEATHREDLVVSRSIAGADRPQ